MLLCSNLRKEEKKKKTMVVRGQAASVAMATMKATVPAMVMTKPRTVSVTIDDDVSTCNDCGETPSIFAQHQESLVAFGDAERACALTVWQRPLFRRDTPAFVASLEEEIVLV